MNRFGLFAAAALSCALAGQAYAAGEFQSRYEKLYDSDGYNYGARVYVTNVSAQTLCVTPFLDNNRTFNITSRYAQSRFTIASRQEVYIGSFVEAEEGDWDIGLGMNFSSGAC